MYHFQSDDAVHHPYESSPHEVYGFHGITVHSLCEEGKVELVLLRGQSLVVFPGLALVCMSWLSIEDRKVVGSSPTFAVRPEMGMS